MDNKIILHRIDWNESRIRELQKEFELLKEEIKLSEAIELDNNDNEFDIISMFDEKYRLQTALKLSDNKRRQAARLCQMSERNFYRLLVKYEMI